MNAFFIYPSQMNAIDAKMRHAYHLQCGHLVISGVTTTYEDDVEASHAESLAIKQTYVCASPWQRRVFGTSFFYTWTENLKYQESLAFSIFFIP